jgi:23S rRNA (adenine2503-C2)-methyltransferase
MTKLLNHTQATLQKWLLGNDENPARAAEILKILHQQHKTHFSDCERLTKSLRQKLQATSVETLPASIDNVASDGTHKWLFKLNDGNHIETVFIPEKNRGTLCVSSQVGCGLNCSFCATGKQGFNRNLTTGEIIAQLWHASKCYDVTNVVFMGMGEPLLNLDNVVSAIEIMLDDNAYGLSKHRVTVSTSGLVPQMQELAKRTEICLAVSLHAPNDPLRNVLVPINKKYNIAMLLDTCRNYFAEGSKRKILYEYVLLQDVNDTPEHAMQLAALLKDMPAKVNLIPFNPFIGSQYQRSDQVRIDQFYQILCGQGIVATTRKTRGDDIAAACGQLKGDFSDRTSRRAREAG